MTFKEYMLTRRIHRDSFAGDFARDVKNDPTFPECPGSWESLQGYLRLERACPEAIDAARIWWRRYQQFLKGPK